MFSFRARRCRPTHRTSVQFRPGVDELCARIAPSGFVGNDMPPLPSGFVGNDMPPLPSGFVGNDMPPLTQADFMVDYTYPETEVVASDDPLFCRVVML